MTSNSVGEGLKNNYIISSKTSINNDKITDKKAGLQSTGNQLVIKQQNKRCLIGFQKGVSKTLKGHLLQGN